MQREIRNTLHGKISPTLNTLKSANIKVTLTCLNRKLILVPYYIVLRVFQLIG